MITQAQIIQELQRQLNIYKQKNQELTEQIKELKHQIHMLEAITLTTRRN